LSPMRERKLGATSWLNPPLVEAGNVCEPWSRGPFQSPLVRLGGISGLTLDASPDAIARGAEGVLGGKFLGPSGNRFSPG
jgi:hypothetical protein